MDAEQSNELLKAIGAFNYNIYKDIAVSRKNEQHCSSGLGYYYALSGLMLSAKNKTLSCLLKCLHLMRKESIDILPLLTWITDDPDITLRVETTVFVDSRIQTDPALTRRLFFLLGIQVEKIDFENKEQFFNKINEYIDRILRRGTFFELEKIIYSSEKIDLINTVHFEAEWQNKFLTSLIYSAPFHTLTNGSSKAYMMSRFMNAFYKQEEEYKIIGLPLKNPNWLFVIFVPQDQRSFENLSINLGNIEFRDFNDPNYWHVYNIHIPKFTVNGNEKIKLYAEKLKISNIFSKKADFRNLVKPEKFRKCKIKDVRQVMKFSVMECGINIDSATLVGEVSTNPIFAEPMLAVNKSFIFQVVNRQYNLVLFTGFVIDPEIKL